MATVVIMPKQGNTVESCIITAWKKKAGDPVTEGEVLCEVETDKALVEIESPAKTGSNISVVAVFEVNSVKKVIKSEITKIINKG